MQFCSSKLAADFRKGPWSLVLSISCLMLMLVIMAVLAAVLTRNLHTDVPHNAIDNKHRQSSIVPECNTSSCKPPSCQCASYQHPGNFPVKEVPMMVMLTFDGAIDHEYFYYFEAILKENFTNPNSCSMKMTFFVPAGNGTNDYTLTRKLYDLGHEIAVLNQAHQVAMQKKMLVKMTGIPEAEIRGARVPFLGNNGDKLLKIIKESNFLYDSSYVGTHNISSGDPPLWPYTLDHSPTTDMHVQHAPRGRYAGVWEVPLTKYACQEPEGIKLYRTLDQCRNSTSSVPDYLRHHFHYHYRTRAPMGIFVPVTWFKDVPGSLNGLVQFLRELTSLPDVWLVSVGQVIDWMKSPIPVTNISSFKPWGC